MRLALTDFRNYREARLILGGEPVVLTGPNGAGKTNLLEALSFLAPGRGLRGAKLTEIDRRAASGCDRGDSGWAVAAVVADLVTEAIAVSVEKPNHRWCLSEYNKGGDLRTLQ